MTDSEGNEIGKLFVGGLSQATNNESLRNYFTQFGELEDAVVMMDNKTGRSRGFGYVKYKDPESVSNALEARPHAVDGKEVDAKQCNINMKGRNRRSLKVFVGGIGLDQDVPSLTTFFEKFGHVTDVNLMMDSNKQRHRGFAFVGFDDESVVNRLINMHYITMNTKQVEIKAMEPPNFGRKNASSLASQNENSDHYSRGNNGQNMQGSGLINFGMQASNLQGQPGNHLQCIPGAEHGIYGLPASAFSPHNASYANNFMSSGDNPLNSFPYQHGGRLISDQCTNLPGSYSENGSLMPGKFSVPFVFANSFIPLTSAVYGSWNSSNNIAGAPNANCPIGAAYPCHILPPQVIHPGFLANGEEFWHHNTAMNVCGQQTGAQNFIYPSYIGSNVGGNTQQQMVQPVQNSLYGSSAVPLAKQQAVYGISTKFTNSSDGVSNEGGQITSSAQTETENVASPNSVSPANTSGSQTSTQSLRMQQNSGSNGVFYPTFDQSQLPQNIWCPQVPGLPLQYVGNLPPAWNFRQTTSPEFTCHSLVGTSQVQNVDRQAFQISSQSITVEDSKMSEQSKSVTKPSGDNVDNGAHRELSDSDVVNETTPTKEEGEEQSSLSEKKEFNEKQFSNWTMQHTLPTWAFALNSGVRAPCWGDVQGGVPASSFGMPPGIIIQPHPSSTSWNGVATIYDPLMEPASSYLRSAGTVHGLMHPRNMGTLGDAMDSGEPYMPLEVCEARPNIPENKMKSGQNVGDFKQSRDGANGLIGRSRKRDSPDRHLGGQHAKTNRRSDNSRWFYNSSETGRIDKDEKHVALDGYKNSAGAAGDHGVYHA